MGQATLTSGTSEVTAAAAPLRGITAGTPVLTLDGELPVQFLAPGDRVITRSGARALRGVEVTVLRAARMMRISASALAPDHPPDDVFVTPTQPILLRDWRARAMFGTGSAFAEAQRLADGAYIRQEEVAEVRVFTLRFDAAEVVYAGGLELACAPAAVTA